MKQFKKRAAALGLAVSMAVTLAACGGGEERQAEYLSRAQEHLDAGNLEKARLDVKNALQINDKSARYGHECHEQPRSYFL